jgi:hypothetical protein
MDCCLQVRDGNPKPTWSKGEVIDALRGVHEAIGAVPPQNFAALSFPKAAGVRQRDDYMRALLATPHAELIKSILGQDDWLGVLRAAGLVDRSWRPSMGTQCYADDGHSCRSLLEKSIDDWFARNGIVHECEPNVT